MTISKLFKPFFIVIIAMISCKQHPYQDQKMTEIKKVNAQMILGNPNYRAISYGGYRTTTREVQPTVGQLMDDIKILSAMGIKVLRTYNVQLPHASNVLKAISQLKQADPSFEMYVMLGAWIDCKNAWTDREPDHFQESEQNTAEIDRVVALAKQYPDIVKIIAVGNEAMVKWAASYFVQPGVILKWVNHIQSLKVAGELPSDLWVTSSDNFASWGGGGGEYHVGDLTKLIEAVDFISLHTYPMHDTHYNPVFWGVTKDEEELSKEEQLEKVMQRSVEYAKMQYYNVKKYIDSLGIKRPLHVGETGWASLDADDHHYGKNGSRACDEYKEALYYRMMREWTDAEGISCFFFEAFDEPWKDAMNHKGSENHFGLFTVDGKAKYAIWEMVDQGVFDGLKREGNAIQKTFGGDALLVLEQSPLPQLLSVN